MEIDGSRERTMYIGRDVCVVSQQGSYIYVHEVSMYMYVYVACSEVH